MRQINEATELPLILPPKASPQPVQKPAEVWKKTDTPGIEINQQGNRRTRVPGNDRCWLHER